MPSSIYKVTHLGEGFLAIMAKPVAGEWIDEEFSSIARFGIKRLVCLLQAPEIRELGLATAADLCASKKMEYLHFPIKDRGIPHSLSKTLLLIEDLYNNILQGANTVIHCRAGIGRTGLLSAAVLVRHGYTPVEAFHLLSKARGVQVPDTREQYDWVVQNQKNLQAKLSL